MFSRNKCPQNQGSAALRAKNYPKQTLSGVLRVNFSHGCCRHPTLASRSSTDPHPIWLDYRKRIPELFTQLRHRFDHGDRFGLAHTAVKLHENDTG